MYLLKKPVFIILVLSVFSLLPLFRQGFFPMHDDTQVSRVYQMQQALSDGQIPVRWVEDLGYGYRYPIFNFYAPLPYYAGAVFLNITKDALVATKLLFALGIILSGISMYFFAKEILGKLGGIVAAVAYLYFPYHAVNIYIRGAIGEFFGYAFLPLCFLGMYMLYKRADEKSSLLSVKKWVLSTAIFLSLLLLSHNLSAFIFFYSGIIFTGVLLVLSKNKKKFLILLSISSVLAFLLSAFYIVPMVLEAGFTNVSSQVGGGADFKDHFVCLSQLWNSPWGFAGSAPGCVDGVSFKLGKLHILLGFTGLVLGLIITLMRKYKYERHMLLVSIVLFFFSIIMTLEVSKSVWSILPFMDFVQFPWRFLNISGIFLSLLIAFLPFSVSKFIDNTKSLHLSIVTILLFALIFFNAKLFVPSEYNNRESGYYTDRQNLRYQISKISDEYLPAFFEKPISEAEVPPESFDIVLGEGVVLPKAEKSTEINATISTQMESRIRANIAPYPGWNIYVLKVNGEDVEYLVKENGIYFSLPEGEYTVSLAIEKSIIQQSSELMTLTGLIIFLIGIIAINGKKNESKTS